MVDEKVAHERLTSDAPPTLELLRANAGIAFSADKRALIADAAETAAAFAALRGLHVDGNEFATPKGDGRIILDLGWFNPALLHLGPEGAANARTDG